MPIQLKELTLGQISEPSQHHNINTSQNTYTSLTLTAGDACGEKRYMRIRRFIQFGERLRAVDF
jgi:hypothetical protein